MSSPSTAWLGFAAVMRARSKGFISTGLIVRIAIATTVAYLLAQKYSGSPLPVFAPMTTPISSRPEAPVRTPQATPPAPHSSVR